MINEMTGHFEEKNENKHLVLDHVGENKEVFKKYEEFWEGVNKIETINGNKKVEYGKDFKNIRFECKDDLPMHKLVKLNLLTGIIGYLLVRMVNFTLNYF